MEVQLQEIINKIKKEGLETASQDAANLKLEAEKTAKAIIEKAQLDAEEIKTKAKSEAEKFSDSSKAALAQASRDLTLTVKKNLEVLFAKLVEDAVKSSYSQKVLEEAILLAAKNWTSQAASSVLANEKLQKSLVDSLKGKLKDAAGKEIKIDASPTVQIGFRLQDGGAYYDFTAETIAKALSAYVNPVLAEILKAQG